MILNLLIDKLEKYLIRTTSEILVKQLFMINIVL